MPRRNASAAAAAQPCCEPALICGRMGVLRFCLVAASSLSSSLSFLSSLTGEDGVEKSSRSLTRVICGWLVSCLVSELAPASM
jgi:hypothetical protein